MTQDLRSRPKLISSAVLALSWVGLATALGCADPLRGGGTHSGGASGQGGAVGTGGIHASGGAPSPTGGADGPAFTLPSLTYPEVRRCGNAVIESPEQCDDGNTILGDGCSRVCQIEFGYDCPEPGKRCIPHHECGDGALVLLESCDDGNTVSGDGCSEDCTSIERGWSCRVPGRPCRPVCGDGLVMGDEGCDDGNTLDGDGCSKACQVEGCRVAPLDASSSCDVAYGVRPFCGDGIVTPDEECDCGANAVMAPGCPSGNDDATYNGCTTRCTWGPYCGDGVVGGPEACDLGRRNGSVAGKDGCTKDCKIPPYCGDGILDTYREDCDLGERNGVKLDLDDFEPDDSGYVFCSVDCTILPGGY
jgi:cysteine-rich repeat protein